MKRKTKTTAYDWEASERTVGVMYEKGEIDYDTWQELLGEIAADKLDYDLHGKLEFNATEHY